MNVPPWIEPLTMAFWSLFFLLWGPGRRGVMCNLKAIKPGSWAVTNFFRCYRVFWNYAWTIADNVRFKEMRVVPDWELTGSRHFEAMMSSNGGILLTAHMGSYDLAAHLFAEMSARRMIMVRAPEIDPHTRQFEESNLPDQLQIEFNVKASDLALELLHALRDGGIVAIQGDRVAGEIAVYQTTLFGKPARVPAGPFALAMTASVPIHPVFVVRRGRRRYRLVAGPPISVTRSKDRDEALAEAVAAWTAQLEEVIRAAWYQWFAFEPFSPEPTA